MNIENIRNLPVAEAVEVLDKHIACNPDDERAYTLRGMRHWALGHRALAINDYLKAINLNPESKAVQLLENAQSILDYYNKDLLNP